MLAPKPARVGVKGTDFSEQLNRILQVEFLFEFLNLPVSLSCSLSSPVFPPEDIGPKPFVKIIQKEFCNYINGGDQRNGTEDISESRGCGLGEDDETDDESGSRCNEAPADGL